MASAQAQAFATMMMAKTNDAANKAIETFKQAAPNSYQQLVESLGEQAAHSVMRGLVVRGIHIGSKLITDFVGVQTPSMPEL